MLSISNIGATQASNYYAKDDYYIRNESDDRWLGKLREELGLPENVKKEDFDRLLAGKKRAGFDLCFSAPKSVSIAYTLPEVREDMLKCHAEAVRKTLELIEAREIGTRTTHEKKTEHVKTGNMIAGKFTHVVSRNHDPQLHTHAVILNLTKHGNKWYAVDNPPLYTNKIMYGQIYRNTLSQELQKCGYSVTVTDPEKGFFELSSIPQNILDKFSTRRQEIVAKLREWRTSTPDAAERATLLTRQAKKHKDIDTLLESWQETLQDMGGIHLPRQAEAVQPSPEQKQEEFDQAVDRLSGKSFAFTEKEMKRAALAAGVGSGMTEAEYYKLLDVAIEQKAVLQLTTAQGETYYSTPRNMQVERQIFREVTRTKNIMPGLDPAAVEQSLQRALTAGKAELSVQQRQAVMHIAGSRDQYVAVQGLAGTGKTHMLNYARQVLEAGGYTVRGACFTGKAAQGLAADAQVSSTTIHAFLNRLEKEAGQAGHTPRPDVDKKMKTEWDFTGLRPAKSKEVWVLDEASMVDNSTMCQVMEAARLKGTKVIMVGDRQQLLPVGTGNAFATLTESGKITTVTLNEIRRQKDPELLRAVREAVSGSTEKSMSILAENTQVIEKRGARLKALVRDYVALSPNEQRNTVILTAGNRDRREINQAVRTQLKKSGQLAEGKEFTVVDPANGKESQREFSIGDKIICLKNDYKIGVKNGQTGVVVGIADNAVGTLIVESSGQKIAINTVQYYAIDHGYAMTGHKAQGITVDRVLVHLDSSQKHLNSRNAYYVDISRARHHVQIYTDDTRKIQSQIQSFAKKLTTEDFILTQHEQKTMMQKTADIFDSVVNSLKNLIPSKQIPQSRTRSQGHSRRREMGIGIGD